jgi:hypothetical protein
MGQMMIYEEVQQGNKMFNLKGTLETPTPEQAVRGNIAHELGHGIDETAMTQGSAAPLGADPHLFDEYNPAVGWAKDGHLYDIQEPAVQKAIQDKAVPPSDFLITKYNFQTKPWKEQPLTGYMATRPDEDFAEAIRSYVYQRDVLKKLSPARFKFIEDHKGRWIASGHPELNVWEQAKAGRSTRVLKPSEPAKN